MGNYVKLAAAFALSAVLVTTACKKDERCSIHPEPFRFSIVDKVSRADLLATQVYREADIRIYYLLNDERKNLIVNRETKPDGDLTEMTSAQLPMISLTGLSDLFFLELSASETDTLMVVVEREIREDCDYHPYTLVKYNGVEIPIMEGKAFILEK